MINTSDRTILIKNGFRISTIPPAKTTFQFQVPGIRNPLSLEPSDSFKFYTYTSDQHLMDKLESGVTVQMLSTAYMKSVGISLGSYVNSAKTKYTFQITATIPILASHYIIIQFPPEVTLPSSATALSCLSDDSSLFDSITCSFNS